MASACLLGVPAARLVYGDLLEQVFWHRVAERALELDATRRDNLSISIANQVARLFRRIGRARAR